ncbi:MAG: bifunctional folylpolyglutamate synthase/dihydrofolate synthase [Flavipsychrobacter sp.]|nr:bifunctional folylpolyglutamate synthase/dihydrofolate synthase [Flavipsychrobacter sp.]
MTDSVYQQTLDYLYTRLPMFSKLGKDAIKADLTNIRKLCTAFGDPQLDFKTIHIAGTNGKGSTSHMLAAILQQSGYKTGLYTSPHILDFRERIRVNGICANREWIVNFVERCKEVIEEIQPSFFEITVIMALMYFKEQQVDIAVIETGLGGRLDSTNIIIPILSIITNISYDHKDILGNTLAEIAAEKAGIIKPMVPVVIGEQQPETENVFFEHALRNQTTLFYAESLWDLVRIKQDEKYQYFKAVNRAQQEMYSLKTDLLGTYQRHNIITVLAACDILKNTTGLQLSFEDIKTALAHVKQLTGLRGRWEWLQQNPIIIADVGHNAAGMSEVMAQWAQVPAQHKHIVVGFVKDKEIDDALALFPKNNTYYFCNAQIPRALPAAQLQEQATLAGLHGDAYATVAYAVNAATKAMSAVDALLITGSFFVVGEALERLAQDNS